MDWARLVPRVRILSNVDDARDPEAFLGKSPLIDLLSLGIAEQLVAFIGRNSFFCLDFATRKFLYGGWMAINFIENACNPVREIVSAIRAARRSRPFSRRRLLCPCIPTR